MTADTRRAHGALCTLVAALPIAFHDRHHLLCKIDRRAERDDPATFTRFAERAARAFTTRKGN